MKTISPDLREAMASGVTTLCQLWTITPFLRTSLYFTNLDRDVDFDGNTYKSAKGFEASSVENTLGGSKSNLDIHVLLDPAFLSRIDVERGLILEAAVELRIIDYMHPEYGSVREFAGTVKEVSVPTSLNSMLSLSGNMSRMSRQLTEQYYPTCRADLGDARCGINIDAFSADFEVDSTTGQTFTSSELAGEPNNRYKLGSILWNSGDNSGLAQEVLTNTGPSVRLFFLPPFPIQAGDVGTIYRGCAKTVAACKGYNNIVNYRGEPYVPGEDFVDKAPIPAPVNNAPVRTS